MNSQCLLAYHNIRRADLQNWYAQLLDNNNESGLEVYFNISSGGGIVGSSLDRSKEMHVVGSFELAEVFVLHNEQMSQ